MPQALPPILRPLAILLPLLSLAAAPATRPSLPLITWDPTSLRLIERNADYARLSRLPDNSVGCVYDRAGQMYFRRSTDNGHTFAPPTLVASDPDCWLTNAFLLPLRDGTLLYLWNERPKLAVAHEHNPAPPPGLLTRPFLIRAARSSDLGQTWSPPQTLYTAGPTFQDGCWEPAAIQLPTGEIHVYFANEAPFPTTDEQEISLLRSTDNGLTWSPAERVGFRAHHRDGMPAPLLLPDGTITVAIEDNGLSGDRFKISTLSTPDNWRSGPVLADSPHRHPALVDPLPPQTYAGAPFLVRLTSSHTVLSFQESDDGSLRHCHMAVCVGDASAQHFAGKSYPVPAPTNGNQAWNSLFVVDGHTVTAVLTTTVDNVRGVWAIDGRVAGAAASR